MGSRDPLEASALGRASEVQGRTKNGEGEEKLELVPIRGNLTCGAKRRKCLPDASSVASTYATVCDMDCMSALNRESARAPRQPPRSRPPWPAHRRSALDRLAAKVPTEVVFQTESPAVGRTLPLPTRAKDSLSFCQIEYLK